MIQIVGKGNNASVSESAEGQHLPVAGHNQIRVGRGGAFQDSVVGLVGEYGYCFRGRYRMTKFSDENSYILQLDFRSTEFVGQDP